MTEKSALLSELEMAVSRHDDEVMSGKLDTVMNSGISPAEISRAIMLGLDDVRRKLMSNDASIPEFLLCVDTMTEGLCRLSQSVRDRVDDIESDAPILVIGVVEGDPHDLGKSIIAAVYRAGGYRVMDLGCQVPQERFVKTVLESGAKVLALSAMMSTTSPAMGDIIQEVKIKSPETVVMVGGAPLDAILAKKYGADGFAETAVTVLEETEMAIKRVAEGKAWLPSLKNSS
jgi:methanogenic corrinoid protein MtbC1